MTSGQEASGTAGTQQELSPALQHLLERTRYPLVQENGHRRYGPPPDWEGKPPPKGCEVYVARIPRDMLEDELVPVMERVGRLYEMRLMQDHEAANRGYAFVQYCSQPEAEAAVRVLKDVEVRPKHNLDVSRSMDNNRLFVGGIPKTCTQEEVLEEMQRVTEGVVKVILYPCINDRSKNRGYAFVEYTNHKAALTARRKLFSGRQHLWGAEVKVDWAAPEHTVGSDIMAKVRVLYVRNLALCTTEDDIRIMCNSIADGVERVKKQKDFAFVHFPSRDKAQTVMDALQGRMVDGCRLEVYWARPVKNREEYHLKKAQGRHNTLSALNGPHHTYLPHLSLTGEPMMLIPQMRKPNGTHGLHHPTHPILPAHPHQPLEATLLNLQAASFLPAEPHHHPHLKAPSELVLPGYPNVTAPLVTEKMMTQSTEEIQGSVHTSSPVPRVIPTGQALRGTPIAAPQYFMPAPQYYLTPQTMAQAAAPPPPQAIPTITSQSYLYPATPTALPGYEGINPYLQAAFYQQAALLSQPTMATVDRHTQRYATTE